MLEFKYKSPLREGSYKDLKLFLRKKEAEDFISCPKRPAYSKHFKNTISGCEIVFTDVDCGYCRKFHGEIDDFNAQGITVKYVAFPRSGLESESYDKIVGAWCSTNPKETLTALKQGLDPDLSLCQDHPVEEHFMLGQKIGITGTPAIISSSGDLLPGYLPPMELLKRLN
jgi:thiol:disulfide interchange protein DsbC